MGERTKSIGFSLAEPGKLINLLLPLFFVYSWLLKYAYENIIVEKYSYVGYTLNTGLPKTIISISMIFAIWAIVFKLISVSNFVRSLLLLLVVFQYLPIVVYYNSSSDNFILVFANFIFLIAISLVASKKSNKTFEINERDIAIISPITYWVFFSFVFVLFAYTYGLKFNFKIFSLNDVYGLREDNKEATNLVVAYLKNAISYFLIPFFIINAYLNKKWAIVAYGVILSLFIFMCTGHKTILFTVLLLMLTVVFFKNRYLLNTFRLFFGFVLVSGVVVYFHDLNSSFEFGFDILIRRAIFTAPLLSGYYFDYYDTDKLYFSRLIPDFIIKSDGVTPAFKIGQVYFDKTVNANSGILTDGYINLGIFGVAIFGVILGLIIRNFDRGLFKGRYHFLFIIAIFLTIESELKTYIFTHGLLIFLLVYVYYEKRYKSTLLKKYGNFNNRLRTR